MSDLLRLLEPMIPALRRYARALLRDRAAADDLVQDCLERAISRWHQLRAESDARTWVFTILHHLAINRLRQKARRGPHVELDAIEEAVGATLPAQEVGLTYRDLLERLGELPEEQRSVLLLVSVENLSYAETARVLGVPLGTVMSRLGRARDRLLRAMDPGAIEDAGRSGHLRRVK